MSVPDSATLQALIDDAIVLGFLDGAENTSSLAAYEIGWEMAERAVGTNLLTGTDCEVYSRPTGWLDHNEAFAYLMLKRHHLVSVESVTINHDQFTCDCDNEDVSGCAVVYNDRLAIIRLESCQGPASCACGASGRPGQITVCAVSGLYNTLGDLPQTIKVALALIATWWVGVMDSGGSEASSGFVDTWRSMDYSESLGFIEKNVIGTAPQLAAAWQLLRQHRVLRGIGMRGSYPSQPPHRVR